MIQTLAREPHGVHRRLLCDPRTLCVYRIFGAKSSEVKTYLFFLWMHCNNDGPRQASRCVTDVA